MLVECGPNSQTQHPLAHPVDEHDSTKLRAWRCPSSDRNAPFEWPILARLQARVGHPPIVDVKVHFHGRPDVTCWWPGHVGNALQPAGAHPSFAPPPASAIE